MAYCSDNATHQLVADNGRLHELKHRVASAWADKWPVHGGSQWTTGVPECRYVRHEAASCWLQKYQPKKCMILAQIDRVIQANGDPCKQ